MTAICRACGATITYDDPEGLGMRFELVPTICNHCDDIRHALADAERQNARLLKWQEMCPRLYQETDLSHPDMPDSRVAARVLDWPYGPKGLIVRGDTRTCKTRLCWLLMRRLLMEGHSVRAMTSSGFAAKIVAAQRSDDPQEPCRLFDDLTECAVLFIDDLGKFKLTERVEEQLFDVIETRFAWKRPLVTTTNLVGSALIGIMSPDRGGPFVERLREFCEDVAL